MSIFTDLEAPKVEVKNPRDWSLEECKGKLRVQFRKLKTRPDCVSVSVRLGGVTPLKITEDGRMSIHVNKAQANASSFLEAIVKEDERILDAHKRYVEALDIARTTRHTTLVKPRKKKIEPALVVNHVTTSAS
jgi:hypothetical protein